MSILPILGLAAASSEITAAFRRNAQYRDGFIRQWSEASAATRPAIVFVPGFLTESDPKAHDFDNPWRLGIERFAREHDFASYVLHWPSGTVVDLFAGPPLTSLLSPVIGSAALGPLSMLLPGAPLFMSTLAPAMVAAFETWRRAIRCADAIGQQPDRWVTPLQRPVILVGHSLGGRIALHAGQSQLSRKLLATIALAPAVDEQRISLAKVAASTLSTPVVWFSPHDWVLKGLYHAAERAAALGLEGTKHPKFRDIDASLTLRKRCGHHHYSYHVYESLHQSLASV